MKIKCGTHGSRVAAVVCQHMVESKDKPVGFVENSPEPDDLQAWCNECERLFTAEGSMTDRFKAFHGHVIVCDFCYDTLKNRHSVKSPTT